ncbi:hypothetical protein SOVF_029880 [Spinacia oleracea]|uniref:Kunitz trypsin inhibitor 5-like n=1 Tax=Spinacia oleracea TaxID=3562 RepID=A0A9R0I5P4_SPIOL|nr:kunitz trypsin inhibitor 5-like [Spinacia oleracea]KNA22880.1 hypothetical protein SOVF_029880 [Spinacia oleracea]
MISGFSIISATTFFLLFFLLPCGNAGAAGNAVLDTNGRPLRARSRYYIVPVAHGQGGGLTMLSKNTTSFCPLYVVQEMYPGLPVWFLPNNPRQRLVTLSSDLNILFNAISNCLQSVGWQLTVDHTTGRKYVATGGAIGNPGEETVSSWFNIEKVRTIGRRGNESGNHYKIVFCPNVCEFCMVMCGDVGVFVQEDGTRLLALTDRPLHVMFKKAKGRSLSS